MAKKILKGGPSREEAEVKEAPAKKASSKAELFDSAAPKQAGVSVPHGQYEAVIAAAEFEQNKKGEAIKFTYEIVNNRDEELNGKTISAWYNLFDADDEPKQGLGFWKRDAEILGYDSTYDDLDDTMDEITKDRPEVVIAVKKNGQYTNVYLQGLAEG